MPKNGKRKRFKFEEFHPMLRKKSDFDLGDYEQKRKLANLPNDLTNEEIEKKWEKYINAERK